MGNCLSSGSSEPRTEPSQSPSNEVATRAVLDPDPGQSTIGRLLERQELPLPDGTYKVSTECSPESENLQPSSPPLESEASFEVADLPHSKVALPGRPKPQFGPQDSQMTVYPDVVESGPSEEPGLPPALPHDAQMNSTTVTPDGNVLMQLNRAMILRNRMGAGQVGLPHIVKPPLPSADSTSHCSDRQNEQPGHGTLSTQQQLTLTSVPPLVGAGSFPTTFTRHAGNDNACDSNHGVRPVGCSNTTQGGSTVASGNGSQSSIEPIATTGSAPIGMDSLPSLSNTAFSGLGSGAGSGASNFSAPLYGLGVEATLSEMHQMALIGSGGGGCVYVGRWRGVRVAVKFIVSSNDDQLTRSQREAILSRLASHPHVVQTYATSVTQLTNSLMKAKDDAQGGAIRGGITAASANISHDLLAGLSSGSWIRGEVQMAMQSGESYTAPAATAVSLLPTILETTTSSRGSGSASMTAVSGRGVNMYESVAGGCSSSVSHIYACTSDGQMSSTSTNTRARVGDAPRLASLNALPTLQVDASNHTANGNNKRSCVCGAQDKFSHLLRDDCVVQDGIRGALGSGPTSASAAEGPLTCGIVGPGVSCGGSRQGEDALSTRSLTSDTPGLAARAAAAALAYRTVIAEDAARTSSGGRSGTGAIAGPNPQAAAPPSGACCGSASTPDSNDALTSARAAQATRQTATPGNACGLADSFDASFVRDHLGLAKYSIHEVLRQLGAHEGQFLTMVIMEHCDGGSLLAALREGPFHRDTTSWSPRMWLRSTVRTALEIAYGMQHLHLSGLVHGDLKPGNVLLKGSNQDKRRFVAKVSDLGVTHPLGTEEEMAIDDNQIGSIAYMAPEVFRGRIMKASDVYSFGVLLWQLVCGTGAAPFEGAHPIAIALGISEGRMTLRWPQGVFKPLQQLGELCLQTEPAARPSFKSVVGALEKLERHMQRLSTTAVVAGASAGHSAGGNLPSSLVSSTNLSAVNV